MGQQVGIENLISIDIQALVTIVVIMTVEVIGIMQWLKNFFKCKKAGGYAIVTLILLLPCAYIHSPLVQPIVTTLFDLVFLPLAVIQLAYEIIIQKFPLAVSAFIDKLTGVKLQAPTATQPAHTQSDDLRGV